MKLKFAIPVLLLASLAIFSCSKDKNKDTTDPEENGPAGLMTKMTQGLVPGWDTVFVFSYDANKRIKSVIDRKSGG
jgi:hypothetical protein